MLGRVVSLFLNGRFWTGSFSYARSFKRLLMPVFCLRLFYLSLEYHGLKIRHFQTRVASLRTHHQESDFRESLLFEFLSQRRGQEALKVLEKFPERDRHGHVIYWTSLLSRFTQSGFVDEARMLFDLLPEKNLITYNAMLSGYVQSGRFREALKFFDAMPEKNVISWTAMLCGLSAAGRIIDAKRLFEVMPERNIVSWNSMLVCLVRSGDLEEARQLFDHIQGKNIVSVNTMIAGYAENHRMDEALVLFDKMECRNVITWTTMIAGYCRIGKVDEAYMLFQITPDRNIVSWTAMIGGFAWNDYYEDALKLFLMLQNCREVKPNVETFISLAYACAGIGLVRLAKQLHAHLIVKSFEYDDYDGRLSKSLIYMYSTLNIVDFAQVIFLENSNFSSVQCCNFMLSCYIRIGRLEEAENLFSTMPFRDKISWTSMINGYFSVGNVSEACYLFRSMPERDYVAWTAMISGQVQNEKFVEANCLFSEMRAQGFAPLNSAYAVLLGAAGAMADLDQGRQLHCSLMKTFQAFDVILENSLVAMYSKCGEIACAYRIFSKMIVKDLVSWNSMINGFADNGLVNETLGIFAAMLESGTLPNSVTFLGILSACGNTGHVNLGLKFFDSMRDVYGIQPRPEHYISMINLLGRAGKLKEAEELVLSLPFEPDHAVLGALLGVAGPGEASAEIARRTAKQVLELDRLNAAAHVVLCKVYAANGMQNEEEALRKEMGMKGVRKAPGFSWIMLSGNVHVFLSGDKPHPLVDDMLHLVFSDYE